MLSVVQVRNIPRNKRLILRNFFFVILLLHLVLRNKHVNAQKRRKHQAFQASVFNTSLNGRLEQIGLPYRGTI